MSVVVTKDLCRRYGLRRGISNINLTIEPGEIFGFLGPNGAGKSTTIRVLMGLLPAGSGMAQVFQRDCWTDGPAIRSEVGYVAGDVRLYPWLTTRRGLSMLSRIHGRELIPHGMELAERFRLEPDLPVRKMSRGNRQKVALVLAMAHSPKLLILDEPTSGLDPLMQDTLLACLREMALKGGTVMFSSHTLSEVETLCDHIAIVRDGCIVEDSTLEALQAQAPRQITITLREDQSPGSISWPEFPGLTVLPTLQESALSVSLETALSQEQSKRPPDKTFASQSRTDRGRGQTVHLELHGVASSFIQWAAAQSFQDIIIGPPSLDVLFRKYYDTSSAGANSEVA